MCNIINMKKFSIGSKKENAKQININLERKHLVFAGVIFVFALLFHTFVYSPYLEKGYQVSCFNGTVIDIEDNMSMVCNLEIPEGLAKEEIYVYIEKEENQLKDLEVIIE